MQSNFIVVGQMRNGSSYLCSSLSSHPDITCHLELLHRKNYNGELSGVYKYLADSVFSAKTKFRGFKLLSHQMWGHNTVGCYILKSLISSFECKVIHIVRRNHLESYVSNLLAKKSNIWNVFDKERVDNHFVMYTPDIIEKYNQKINIKKHEYDLYCRRALKSEQFIDQLYPNNFKILYEEMPDKIQDVLKYLGAESVQLYSGTVKLRNKCLAELIENYDEVLNWSDCGHF